jgi:hypothetical protein
MSKYVITVVKPLIRVASWYICTPNGPILVNCGGMENIGTIYGWLVYFIDVWYILWTFGLFCSYVFGIILLFWYIVPREIWQPWESGLLCTTLSWRDASMSTHKLPTVKMSTEKCRRNFFTLPNLTYLTWPKPILLDLTYLTWPNLSYLT